MMASWTEHPWIPWIIRPVETVTPEHERRYYMATAGWRQAVKAEYSHRHPMLARLIALYWVTRLSRHRCLWRRT